MGADLTGADLRYMRRLEDRLSRSQPDRGGAPGGCAGQGRLDGALLVWAHLDGADLQDAKLTGAVLREAIAPEVHLEGADLRYAFLRKADLAGAELSNARLDNADLAETELADLSKGDLIRAKDPLAELDYQTKLTFGLFQRACDRSTGAVHAVVARIWHELDYSASHDREGYAGIAGLRYLLAKLILSRRACPGADDIHDRDVCRLHEFLNRWTAVRIDPEKPFEPELQRNWSDLRKLISAGQEQPMRKTVGAVRTRWW